MERRLPIYEIEDGLLKALRQGNRLAISAPTGSGKTTQVPRMLMESGLVRGRVVVLQPRRLAARMVSQRVARELGTELGGLVGYQVRGEGKSSGATKLLFVTEGVFLRMMQDDPMLSGVGAVILDEFHERNLTGDVAVALSRRVQEQGRADLKLLVMSATLDVEGVCRYLNCPSLQAGGRTFPVKVHYLTERSRLACWDVAAEAVDAALRRPGDGDVLVFMPGVHEIRRTIGACRRLIGDEGVEYFELHGELSPARQDAVMEKARGRKVIVSTNVAETSITIEGVRYVVDSGLARVHRFDPRRGINVLMLEPISRASAEQRAGRAGRTSEGDCFRLWPEREHVTRAAHQEPEVKRLDLAEAALTMKGLGVEDIGKFDWLERPAAEAVERAMELLGELGAVDEAGRLTDRGAVMARLPMHPRLSRMLVEASERGCLERAAIWAAAVSEREILIEGASGRLGEFDPDELRSDLVVVERALAAARGAEFDVTRCQRMGIHGAGARQLDRTASLFMQACNAARLGGGRGGRGRGGETRPGPEAEYEALVRCLLSGFADHLAVRRREESLDCALIGIKRGMLDEGSVARRVGLLCAVERRELREGQRLRTKLGMVSEVKEEWVEQLAGVQFKRERATIWNQAKRWAEAVERVSILIGGGELVIAERVSGEPDALVAEELMAQRLVDGELKLTGWDEKVETWIRRVRLAARNFPERRLVEYGPDDLRLIHHELASGAVRFSQVEGRDCLAAVRSVLGWEDQQFVEKMTPERISLPEGRWLRMEYLEDGRVKGSAKIQELYGLMETPRICGGRVKVLVEILGPNYRPVQVTDDLAGFWAKLYPELKKELKRRYPRQDWR